MLARDLHPQLLMKSTIPHTIVPRLAQEIIDNIIDWCTFPRDLKILRNCSLVCRSFLPRSQRHIFIVIRISCAIHQGEIRTGGRRLDELYDILQHSPHIAGYVREIRLVVKDNDGWAAGNPKFEWIMDHLTRNRVFNRFHIDGHLSSDKILISPSHLQSFEQCFSQRYIVPFITSLKLYRVKNVPISLLVSSSRLKKLSLIRTTLGDIQTRRNPSINKITLPKLQELFFYRCSDTVSTLLGNPLNGSPPLIDLSQLYTLSINQDSLEDVQCAVRVIQVAPSLRQINFIHRTSNNYVPMTGTVNLGAIPHLRTLRIDTVCGDKEALADLANILNTVRPTHKITKVRITLHMSNRTPIYPGQAIHAGCTKLDSVMTKLHEKKSISFDLQFFFPRQPSRVIFASKQTRALAEIGEMSKSEFTRLVLSKLPLASVFPGITITVNRQKDYISKGALRGMKFFLRRVRELVRER